MNVLEERFNLAGEGGYLPGRIHDTPDEGPPIDEWWPLDIEPFEAGQEIGEALFFLTAAEEAA